MSSNVIDSTIHKIEEKLKHLVADHQAMEEKLRDVEKDYRRQVLELTQEREALVAELNKVRLEYGRNSSELTSENELLKYQYQQLIERVDSLKRNF